jgi:hypothetical protein
MNDLRNPSGNSQAVRLYFVLPYVNYPPRKGHQGRIDRPVAFYVAAEFIRPDPRIIPRPRSVDRAAVPETSIDEHGYSCRRKDDVGRRAVLPDRFH